MYSFVIFLFLFYTPLNFHDISTSDSSVIFSPNRTYHYDATFIGRNGDTLSKEEIIIRPLGKPWKWAKNNQTSYEVFYNYTLEDSTVFASYGNPMTKNTKKPAKYIWNRSEITGAIENKEEVWMHPIRSNQYNYTEIAPFPGIRLDSLEIGKKWETKLLILTGWRAFNGKVICNYQVMKQEDRRYGNLNLENCWWIQATGNHSKLGLNYLDFYYHPSYGFVEMSYRFYDGARILFILKAVGEEGKTP